MPLSSAFPAALVWTSGFSTSWLTFRMMSSRAPPTLKTFVTINGSLLLLLSLAFYQDQRLTEKRLTGLASLKRGTVCFLEMDSLAPPISSKELDAATGRMGEQEAKDILVLGQRLILHEEANARRFAWLKIHSLFS